MQRKRRRVQFPPQVRLRSIERIANSAKPHLISELHDRFPTPADYLEVNSKRRISSRNRLPTIAPHLGRQALQEPSPTHARRLSPYSLRQSINARKSSMLQVPVRKQIFAPQSGLRT